MDSIFAKKQTRRDFVETCAKSIFAVGVSSSIINENLFASTDSATVLDGQTSTSKNLTKFIKEASWYNKLDNKVVQCSLCPHQCYVHNGQRGLCGVRENQEGKYYTLVHSSLCALHVDPIEKKPLFHYHPGQNALSMATPGCNISCRFCQNWQISQSKPEEINCKKVSPAEIVAKTIKSGSKCIAYTYSEPTIFYEFMYDTAKLANERGVKSVIISNGYINEKPHLRLLNQLDAVKIDLKSFSDNFYRTICRGSLKPVLESLKRVKKNGTWLEIVVLVIPTLNDSREEITEMANWISGELGDEVPVHFSRFTPQYKLKNLPVTPVSTIDMCISICKEKGLKYIYAGNVPGHQAENTYCPSCDKMLIKRYGHHVMFNKIKDSRCPFCNTKIAGIFA